MSKRIFAACMLIALFAARPARLDAQMGGIIDWIIKLSGPGFARTGPSFAVSLPGGEGALLRGSALLGTSTGVSDADNPPDAKAFMFSLQGILEFPVTRSFDIGLGAAYHRFFEGDIDAFSTYSFPLQVGFRPPGRSWLRGFRLAGGVHVIWFPAGAFAPLSVDVTSDGFELGPNVSLVYDFTLP